MCIDLGKMKVISDLNKGCFQTLGAEASFKQVEECSESKKGKTMHGFSKEMDGSSRKKRSQDIKKNLNSMRLRFLP